MSRNKLRRGISLIWMSIAMVTLCAFVSLGVDYGRVQLAKSELRAVADAAARAAMGGLATDVETAQKEAESIARSNLVDGSPLELHVQQDIEFGHWSSADRSFSPLHGSARALATAARITARRTTARGNAVPLLFARVLGPKSCDVTASAVATRYARGYGVIGLDYIRMGGNSSDSYWSPDGYSTPGEDGSIASNGNITLSGSSSIHGDARPGVGMSVIGGEGRVSGAIEPLTAPLVFPNGNAGIYATSNDNYKIPRFVTISGGHTDLRISSSRSLNLQPGNYYFRNFDMSAGSTLSLNGPTTIYFYGSFSVTGNVQTAANMPKNLKIVAVPAPDGTPPGPMRIWSGSDLYADIYAPQSDITFGGNGDVFGSVLGKSIDMAGTSAIHYDTSLTWSGEIVLVQ